jgi:NADH-quinone oxidoreductase subunit L
MYFLVFHGKERFDQNPDAHHDDHHDDHHGEHDTHTKPHESAWVVTLPLILLAIPSVLIGFFTIEPMLFGEFFKDSIYVNLSIHNAMEVLRQEFHGPMALALHGLTSAPFWLALAGVALSYYMYIVNPALPTAIKRIFQPIYTLLENKYYLDWFNENVLARGARSLGSLLWENDKKVIDGTLVNGSWKVVRIFSNIARKFQTGYIYHYAFSMIAGVFLLMTYFVWLKP